MKLLFSILIFLSQVAQAIDKPYIISGFDDVLRQAENTGFYKAAIKILEDDQGFSGMSELYQVIAGKEEDPQFALVSAISDWFDPRINRFLLKSKFPTNHRYLRSWLTEWSIESFKIEKIKEIISLNKNRKYIIIFDNSDASLNLSSSVKKEFSNFVDEIYLRQVQNKVLPSGTIGFYSAFDIILNEFQVGRATELDVDVVAQAILNEKDILKIIPLYALCPHKFTCHLYNKNIENICKRVQTHIVNACKH